jgi:hypothetical protein
MSGWDLVDGSAQHIDVVSCVIGAGVARSQRDRQQLGRVVAPYADRVEPEAALERGPGLILLRWAATSVASTSSTTISARSVPATFDAGSVGSNPQTCRRACERAFSTRASAAGVASSMVRHTVGAEATGPHRSG